MSQLENILTNLSGRNIVVTGDVHTNSEHIQHFAKERGVLCITHKESSFKLETAAKVRKYCQDAQDSETVLILAGLHITEEAEASLLKTLEERDEKITICICVPSTASLEKTILSRSVVIAGTQQSHSQAEHLLGTVQPKRMTLPLIVDLLASEDEFSKMEMLTLLSSAYKIALSRAPSALSKEAYSELLVLIEEAARPGSSLKQVVQTVCLLLPKI
jgi:DNA polymerase III, delta subunit